MIATLTPAATPAVSARLSNMAQTVRSQRLFVLNRVVIVSEDARAEAPAMGAGGTGGLQFTSALFSDAAGNALAVQLGSSSVNVPEPVAGGLMVAAAVAFALGAQHLKRSRAEKDRG
jgi:hypothetical protein